MLIAQSCQTLCDPMDCSPPGSSICGILQARILEWVAISFSRGSSRPRDRTWSPALQANSLASEPPGKPKEWYSHTEEGGRWQVERKKKGFPDQEENPAAAVRALNPNHRPPGSVPGTYCFKQHVLRAFLGNPLCSTVHNDKQSNGTKHSVFLLEVLCCQES